MWDDPLVPLILSSNCSRHHLNTQSMQLRILLNYVPSDTKLPPS